LPTRANHYFGKSVDENPCTEEVNSLKLALSTFALKLDAFEARLKLRRGQKPKRATAPDLAADPAVVADVPLAKPEAQVDELGAERATCLSW
jgi:hypothetical protein